ncbi:MAG TPA: prephenate dehydrogenase/arogenate dehydrogenase family protein [Verrucomicrobiae bacterium]|nr:prephenate dehydrogenase/arogenate dehydrogenase family protein [Verrucomicrobiae bacterium]
MSIQTMRWNNISIVGAGLLGGSIALAARQRQLAAKVFAFVRSDSTLGLCNRLEIADVVTKDIKTAVESSDLVILCTPLSQMSALASKMRPFLKPGTLITDVGSVKASVVNELEPILRDARVEFIGSHPMAGSEKIGVAAARSDLFQNAICLVTPGPRSSGAAVANIESFWKALGGVPVRMNPETHDDLVSRSSHLPHVVAAELANYVLSPVHPKEQALVCANGFRDTTRIASGSPEMWRDIALANRKNLGRVLGVFIEDLQEFQLALERGDVQAIDEFFAKAKQRRDSWRAHSPETSPE